MSEKTILQALREASDEKWDRNSMYTFDTKKGQVYTLNSSMQLKTHPKTGKVRVHATLFLRAGTKIKSLGGHEYLVVKGESYEGEKGTLTGYNNWRPMDIEDYLKGPDGKSVPLKKIPKGSGEQLKLPGLGGRES
jgi:hypothetical protein